MVLLLGGDLLTAGIGTILILIQFGVKHSLTGFKALGDSLRIVALRVP